MHGVIIRISVLLYIVISACARIAFDKYDIDRNNLFEEELHISLGNDLELSENEIRANEILMHWKNKELDESFANPQYYNFSKHFFSYKNDVSKSKVYQIIKKMPKGAALHIHASLMLDADSLLRLTYEDHLYACYSGDHLQLLFADTVPSQLCPFEWTLMSELRNASDNVTVFDSELRKHLTLNTDDERFWDVDINTTWKRFEKVCRTRGSLIKYRPVREKMFYQALKNFYDDNIFYVEIRSGLSELYELDGTKRDGLFLASLYERVTKSFIEDHPDFVGVKLILTKSRTRNNSLSYVLEKARRLKMEMPDLFAGFDLVGQEDLGRPLKDFLPELIEAKQDIDYYFHGGETNWFGTPTDENLIDAILLGSKRIGHAYALLKHPLILAAVKKRDIALEVNLISNVVLSLVRDVRNHPLASYLAFGLPIVLSSDDPGAWDADPLSHDFYVAFVGTASRHADLRLLKQLALNSIKYSSLKDERRDKLFSIFTKRWDEFVEDLIVNHIA